MSYTIDVYRGKVGCQRNIIDFSTYVTMFPQLIAGPIVRYETVEKQLRDRSINAEKLAGGIRRFVVGLGKKVLIANLCGTLWEFALSNPSDERTFVMAWLGAIGYTFQIYFDFSGYSDMAIGLGKMFGFDYEENFNYPYIGRSITEFWRRWHISLSTWFKEYVYIPLGGNHKGKARQIINIMIVWGLTGIWHGASVNFLLWGLYFGVLLICEKLIRPHIKWKVPKAFGHIYMLLLVVFGWVLFAIDDFPSLFGYLKSMIGLNGLWSPDNGYQLFKYLLLLVIAAIGSTPMPKKLAKYLMDRLPAVARIIVGCLTIMVILILSVALIVGDTYNPFLYFRF
jgi:alginate O-acetyltransferase complex protein AlgI